VHVDCQDFAVSDCKECATYVPPKPAAAAAAESNPVTVIIIIITERDFGSIWAAGMHSYPPVRLPGLIVSKGQSLGGWSSCVG